MPGRREPAVENNFILAGEDFWDTIKCECSLNDNFNVNLENFFQIVKQEINKKLTCTK